MESNEKQLIEDQKPFKIIGSFRSQLKLEEENLEKLLKAGEDLPTAIISIIGPASSGKTFLTNLLINYYQEKRDGGWLSKLLKGDDQMRLKGFLWGSVKPYPGVFRPGSEDLATPGIYLWPQPFIADDGTGSKMQVWVMHLIPGKDGEDEMDMKALERFLMLISSRIAEIDVGGHEMRILRHKQYLSDAGYLSCDSIVYILRSGSTNSVAKADAEAKEELEELLKSADMDLGVLDGIEHLNFVKMKEHSSEEPLHDGRGHLNPDLKGITKLLKPVIEKIADDGEVKPIKINGGVLISSNLENYLKSCSKIINELNAGDRAGQELQIPRGLNPGVLETNLDEILDYGPDLLSVNAEEDFVVAKDCVDESQSISVCVRSPDALSKRRISEEDYFGINGCSSKKVRITYSESATQTNGLEQEEEIPLIKLDDSMPDVPLLPDESQVISVDDEEPAKVALIELEKANKEENDEMGKEERKRKLEAERQEEAKQEHYEMIKFAEGSVAHLKENFYPAIKDWIEEKLEAGNIAEIMFNYNSFINTLYDQARHVIPPNIWPECMEIIHVGFIQVHEDILKTIKTSLQDFRNEVRKKLDIFMCFPPQGFEEICNEIQAKVVENQKEHPPIYELVNEGCDKLRRHFTALNEEINRSELTIAQRLKADVIQFHDKEMNRFLKDDVYSLQQLKDIHATLVRKILAAFRNAFGGNFSICEKVEEELATLEHFLTGEFAKYKEKNSEKTKKINDSIQKIFQASKTSYTEGIEKVLANTPDGLELNDLSRMHEGIVNEAVGLLRIKLRLKLQVEYEKEVEALRSYAADYFKEVVKANDEHIQKRKDREERDQERCLKQEELKRTERDSQRREKEAERMRLETDGKRVETDTSRASTSKAISSTAPTTLSFKSCPSEKILPPLIFQLESKQIRIGMNVDGKLTILKNSSGEDITPFLVVLGNDSKFLYGTEAVARKESGDFLKYWWLFQCFLAGKTPFFEKVKFPNGDEHNVNVEFLLGFILSRLKEQVERDQNGKCSTAVITVPFKSASTPRLQVKHGAIIAGFTKVHLVNEVSALAYSHVKAEGRRNPVKNFIVMTEDENVIEAFVYNFDCKLTLVSQAGSYCLEETDGFFTSWAKGFINKAKNLGELVIRQNRNKQLELIRSVCNQALKQADKYHKTKSWYTPPPTPTEFCYSSMSALWRPLLDEYGHSITSSVFTMSDFAPAIGACLLSIDHQFPETVRDLAAFDIIRSCDLLTAQVLPKRHQLPIKTMKLSSTFPLNKTTGEFYQDFFGSPIPIGNLTVRNVLYGWSVTPNLLIDHEGIVRLENVELTSWRTRAFVLPEDYVWKNPNLSDENLTLLQSLLESLPKEIEDGRGEARQKLLEKCEMMNGKFNQGLYKMRTSTAKEMFQKKISEATNFAQHPKVTLEQLKQQMTTLQEWDEKYHK